MTEDKVALIELIEKSGASGLVRDLLSLAAERLPRPAVAGCVCADDRARCARWRPRSRA